MICKTYKTGTLQQYKYVVVLSKYNGKILLSRHKERNTWETQGGHIEAGETPLEAARRELYEESGAVEFMIKPVCDYWAGEQDSNQGANGMVFLAEIKSLDQIPESEMEEVRAFDGLPENLTYPAITPVLFAQIKATPAKKILFGTGNPAKLEAMQRRLEKLNIEIIGLKDIEVEIPSIEEDGTTPLENARKKALGYYHAFHIPVFSCDSGLYIEGIPEEEQPGVHVRTVRGEYLTDEQMIDYYVNLALKYGDLRARYRNAICFVQDENHMYEAMEENMASETFLICSKPHAIRKKGFPLDSLSIDIKTGKYYYDLEENTLDYVEDGFLEFFQSVFKDEIL